MPKEYVISYDDMEDAFWDIINENPDIELRKLMKKISRRVSIVDEWHIRSLYKEYKDQPTNISYFDIAV